MKKIAILTTALALVAGFASCQKESLPQQQGQKKTIVFENSNVTISAKLEDADGSRVSYEQQDSKLQPKWEESDEIIAFDNGGDTYTFVVNKVYSTGVATLGLKSGTKSIEGFTGMMHLIYKKGATTGDINSKSVSINYASQDGTTGNMPAVMTCDCEMTDGYGTCTFKNAGSIVAIYNTKGVPENTVISRISVLGENLSAATIALEGDALKLTPAEKQKDDVSTIKKADLAKVGADGVLETPIYIAVPAGAKLKEICVSAGADAYTFKLSSVKDVVASKHLYVKTAATFAKENIPFVVVAGTKWGTQNLAVSASGKKSWKGNNSSAVKLPGTNVDVINGDYFQWAAYKNYMPEVENDKGLLVYKSFTSNQCVNDGSENGMAFKDGKDFNLSSAPYSNGTTYTKYTNLSDVLNSDDDPAHIVLGEGWRTPDVAEFVAMKNATDWKYDSNDNGYYVYPKNAEENKGEALLFFPFAGSYTTQFNVGNTGNYWSNRIIDASYGDKTDLSMNIAFRLNCGTTNVYASHHLVRYNGISIRPVAD